MSAEPNAKLPTSTPDPALPPATNDNKPASNTPLRPVDPEMAGANSASSSKPISSLSLSSIPTDFKSLVNTTDSTLARLNKLLKSPGGLASFLSTANYALYILAHLHLTAPTRAQLIATIQRYLGNAAAKVATPTKPPAGAVAAPTSPILNLALAVADLRSMLRLTGLIPLYALLKSLLTSTDSAKDSTLHLIQTTQALAYFTFQALENIAVLTNKGVITPDWTNKRFARLGGTAKLVTWACRAWCAGITLEFVRLFREAQLRRSRERTALEKQASPEEKQKDDEKWWSEALVATSWYPMAWHYSVEGGIGLNMGMVGLCGFGANVANFLRLWQGTE